MGYDDHFEIKRIENKKTGKNFNQYVIKMK